MLCPECNKGTLYMYEPLVLRYNIDDDGLVDLESREDTEEFLTDQAEAECNECLATFPISYDGEEQRVVLKEADSNG